MTTYRVTLMDDHGTVTTEIVEADGIDSANRIALRRHLGVGYSVVYTETVFVS